MLLKFHAQLLFTPETPDGDFHYLLDDLISEHRGA